jgi:hypothetical protein
LDLQLGGQDRRKHLGTFARDCVVGTVAVFSHFALVRPALAGSGAKRGK